MDPADTSLLDQLRELDERRPSLPGEHWLTFGAAVYLLFSHRQSTAGRLISRAVGAALLVRALTGRDGPIEAVRRYPSAAADPEFLEVAAVWPYRDRVRITRPRRLARRARG